jgi:hypothetical protein
MAKKKKSPTPLPLVQECREYHQGRVLMLLEFLQTHGLALSEVRIVTATDDRWETRRGRTEAEQQAVMIGAGQVRRGETRTREVLFVVPIEALEAA